jgi:hypothetical protein
VHEEALRQWERRRQAVARRNGYAKAHQANDEATEQFHEAQAALCDAIPLSWAGLAAKAKAFREAYSQGEPDLMRALMLDVAVLSGELDRANARRGADVLSSRPGAPPLMRE